VGVFTDVPSWEMIPCKRRGSVVMRGTVLIRAGVPPLLGAHVEVTFFKQSAHVMVPKHEGESMADSGDTVMKNIDLKSV
jgi:hypothetical protein